MPYVSFAPNTLFSRAMFDFDFSGVSNFFFSGPIRISVSDGFTVADYDARRVNDIDLTTDPLSPEIPWPTEVKAGVYDTFGVIGAFAGIQFSTLTDYDSVTGGTGDPLIASPAAVGLASDINIALMSATEDRLSGISALNSDASFGYLGARGDIFINFTGTAFADEGVTFADFTKSRQVLMHEILHSLGMSHPFGGDPDGPLSADFGALVSAGFNRLGFSIDGPQDLNREYFTIMSYDDESNISFINAYTPMILDIIALQDVYGEGVGTHGTGNDTITAGTVGYRSYFDKGGNDTIDLSIYNGAYVNLGTTITGARHLVGLVTNVADANRILNDVAPESLRWLYGEYENVLGSPGGDLLIGNTLGNSIFGGGGGDIILGGSGRNYLRGDEGDDSIAGGTGFDDINGNMGADTATGGVGDDWVVGGKDNDSLAGDAGADLVYGNLGNDTCFGGDGADTVRGGQGQDLLQGGAGADYLSGDRENDTLTGGGGADIFHSHSEAGVDRITDFNRSEGDQIQLLAGSTYSVAQVGADTVITIGGGGAQLILAGVGMSSLTGAWITA